MNELNFQLSAWYDCFSCIIARNLFLHSLQWIIFYHRKISAVFGRDLLQSLRWNFCEFFRQIAFCRVFGHFSHLWKRSRCFHIKPIWFLCGWIVWTKLFISWVKNQIMAEFVRWNTDRDYYIFFHMHKIRTQNENLKMLGCYNHVGNKPQNDKHESGWISYLTMTGIIYA